MLRVGAYASAEFLSCDTSTMIERTLRVAHGFAKPRRSNTRGA